METQPAWHTAGHQGPRTVNADAVASYGGVVALADGVGDSVAAATAALTSATAAARIPAVAGPAAALLAAQQGIHGGDSVLVIAQPFGAGYRIGWVGDVRAYAWDGVVLRQLTTDHTLAQYFRDHGDETTPRMEHLVTTSVRTATPNSFGLTEVGVTQLLLTTDGVHKTLTDASMTDILRYAPNPAAALVQAAVTAGATDNATAVVLDQVLATRPLPIAA